MVVTTPLGVTLQPFPFATINGVTILLELSYANKVKVPVPEFELLTRKKPAPDKMVDWSQVPLATENKSVVWGVTEGQLTFAAFAQFGRHMKSNPTTIQRRHLRVFTVSSRALGGAKSWTDADSGLDNCG